MRGLVAQNLMADERVGRGRALMLDAVREHAQRLTGIKPGDPELKAGYEETLAAFARDRGGPVYFPYLGSGIGRGPLVELADGSVKYDMINGIGVHLFGHSDPGMIDAAITGAIQDTVMQGNLMQNGVSADLCRELIGLAGKESGLEHCFLTTSGAMANENALKLLFHKRPGADRVLAFEHGFAGRTLALSQITDKPAYRVGLPTVLAVDFVPFYDPGRAQESTDQAVSVLKGHLARYPGLHAGMWMELVQGEGGYYPGSEGFFKALLAVVKEAGLGAVADEVQTFGRTSRAFAFQHFKLDGLFDVVTVGKCLQVCATLFSEAYKPGPGLVSQTFTGASSSLHAARHVVGRMQEKGMYGPVGRVMRVHAGFEEGFEAIRGRHPGWVSGPYGMGGMVAFTPLDGEEKTVKALLMRMFDEGVIAFMAGSGPMRVRFLPACPVMSDAQVEEVCRIVENSLCVVARG